MIQQTIKTMITRMVNTTFLLTLFFIGTTGKTVAEPTFQEVTLEAQSALLAKAIPFSKQFRDVKEPIIIEVVNNNALASAFKKYIGKPIGATVLGEVRDVSQPSGKKAHLICISDEKYLENKELLSKLQNVIIATGTVSLIEKGVHLGVALSEEGTPLIFLNEQSSLKNGIEWSQPILNMAKIINTEN